MGTYHPQPYAVAEGHVGRRLEDPPEATYESYLEQLNSGEQLWLYTTIAARPIVILLDTPHEFLHVTTCREGKGTYVFCAIARD